MYLFKFLLVERDAMVEACAAVNGWGRSSQARRQVIDQVDGGVPGVVGLGEGHVALALPYSR
jgi:hypothetical protein